jgi:hypothetical protein
MPCRLIVTRAADFPIFGSHPAWKPLKSVCRTELRAIDDLITAGNRPTAVTLAYQREFEAAGGVACDTCFFFLVADYVVAEGPLASILARMKSGATGYRARVCKNINSATQDDAPAQDHKAGLRQWGEFSTVEDPS